MDRGRLEAFSDGVFAVAITLLALDLSVAGPGHGSLAHQLGHHWPQFVAYLVSFLTIGIIWVNHHALVRNIAKVERVLLFLNLFLLLFVVLIPFATSTMASYLGQPGYDSHVAMALYAGVFEGMAITFSALFAWTLKEGRTHQPVPPHARRAATGRFAAGNVPYLVAIGIAFVSPPVSLGLIGAVAVYYVFENTPATSPAEAVRKTPPGT
ncbi:MAG TPA: TMEM175 family protein [Acidimicrobiales bacterium]|nr:TMEM175 family protein [Acidimicrobiales bacterium]